MYSYYEKKTSFSGFRDIHLTECINLMKTYPVHEKFGLTLTDLMEYDPDDIQVIKNSLADENDNQNKLINQLKPKG